MARSVRPLSGGVFGNARRVLSGFPSRLNAIIEFLKNVGVVLAALVAVTFFVYPRAIRSAINNFNYDEAWFFVASEDVGNQSLVRPRFHIGLSDTRPEAIMKYTGIMFMDPGFLSGSINVSGDINSTIVGRENPTRENSKIVLVPQPGQCLDVKEVKYGSDYFNDQLQKRLKTIWARGNLINCDRGY